MLTGVQIVQRRDRPGQILDIPNYWRVGGVLQIWNWTPLLLWLEVRKQNILIFHPRELF